jgi:TIR domain
MAFLRPYFEYDAFVSYSHGVRPGDTEAPLRDWTLELIRRLETDIRLVDTEFGNLHIWRDEQIDPTIHLTDGLRAKVNSSGILMIVMSGPYLGSTWCRDELDWFRQQVQDRERDQGRVFVVRAMSTGETTWPDFLRDSRGHALPGFQFHANQDAMPYCWRGSNTNRDAYVMQLGRLQTALMMRLRELRANAERRAKAEAPVAAVPWAAPRPIYLHARREYASICDEIKHALTQDGIPTVSPMPNQGHDIADFARESRARIATAKRCDALALLRGDGDERFIDELNEIGIDERERIEAARGAPLPCAILDRSGQTLPIDMSGFGIERFDLGRDDWRSKFHAWLAQARAHPAAAP